MSGKKGKVRRTRKRRRLQRARLKSKKKIVRHKCLKGRTGTAHSKTVRKTKGIPPQNGSAPSVMGSAWLHATRGEWP